MSFRYSIPQQHEVSALYSHLERLERIRPKVASGDGPLRVHEDSLAVGNAPPAPSAKTGNSTWSNDLPIDAGVVRTRDALSGSVEP